MRRIHGQTIASTANPVAVDTQIGVAGFSAPTLASLGLREATRRGAGDKKEAAADRIKSISSKPSRTNFR